MHVVESDNMYHIDKDFYMSRIEQILSDAEFSQFTSIRMKFTWLENTIPDIVFEISQIQQVTRSMYEKEITKHCKRVNNAIKYLQDRKTSICIPKLDSNSLRITTYSEAAFANNVHLFTQLVRIGLLTDNHHNPILFSYKSCKPRRVALSVLSAKVIAFADLFDDAVRSIGNINLS